MNVQRLRHSCIYFRNGKRTNVMLRMEMNMKKLLLATTLVAVTSACFAQDRAPCQRLDRMAECATVSLANAGQDREAKTYAAPAADKARIYLVRYRTIEPLTKSQISLDGKEVAELSPRTYVVLDVAPGEHVLKAKTDIEFETRISTQAGKSYFVEHQMKLVFNTTSGQLAVIDEARGKKWVSASKRAETNP